MTSINPLAQVPQVIPSSAFTAGVPAGVRVIDHYDLDDGDATHPINVKYVVPASPASITKVTLSWTNLPFRSTVNLNPSSVGTDATAESGHSHSHSHGLTFGSTNQPYNVTVNTLGTLGNQSGQSVTSSTNSDGTGSSGHTHSHTHSLSGTGAQAVTDAASPSSVTAISFDGQDKTSALGGPWTSDVIELDVTSVFPVGTGQWHTILITLAGLGRLCSLLRIYYGY